MQNIIQCYKNYPSIIKIKENFKNLAPFDLPKPPVEDISSIIKSLKPRKENYQVLWVLFLCIPHNLLVAKLYADGLSEDAVTFVYSYLKRRKQGVKINDTESAFQISLSDIPQGSILGPILLNIFINDLFLFIKVAELANFADDNTMQVARNSMEVFIKVLQKESKSAID